MSLTGLGEKIMESEVARTRDEYKAQIDKFYSYLRWCEILQALGKQKSEAVARLVFHMGTFMHAFTTVHLDDHMVHFLTRTDADLLNEIGLFAALDADELEHSRTGWVRILPPDPWPTDASGKEKEITIPVGTLFHPEGEPGYPLRTAVPWVMVRGDAKKSRPGTVIPVRTVSRDGAGSGRDLPAGQALIPESPIDGLHLRATNPSEIRFRHYRFDEIEKVLHDSLLPDMPAPGGSTDSGSHTDRDEKEELEKEGLLDPRLVRSWMERHTSDAWKYGLAVGQAGEGILGFYVALRLTSYLDVLVGAVKPGAAGLVRGGLAEVGKLPLRILTEPCKLMNRFYRHVKGEEPPWTYKERWQNAKKAYRLKAAEKRAYLKEVKEKVGEKLGRGLDQKPLERPLLKEEVSPADLERASVEANPSGFADSVDSPELSQGKAYRLGAVEAPQAGSIDGDRTVLDRKMSQGSDMQPDAVANEQISARRGALENADEKILRDADPKPSEAIRGGAEADPQALELAERSGGKVGELSPEDGLKTEVDASKAESLAGDAAGVVLFIAVDVVMGVLEAEKEKENWEDARDEVRKHVTKLGVYLKKVTGEYLDLMTTYQQTLVQWNRMLQDVFVDPKTGEVMMYPSLMPLAHGEEDPAWYRDYVPVDTAILESPEFHRLLVEDGLPREIQGVSDPEYFVQELATGSKLAIHPWSPETSSITWLHLLEIARDHGVQETDPGRFSDSPSFDASPLNVFNLWSQRTTANLVLILEFRVDLIHWLTNQKREQSSDWPQKKADFVKKMRNQVALMTAMNPEALAGYPAYSAAHPPAPPIDAKDGTPDEQFQYYEYLYGFLAHILPNFAGVV